SGLGCDTGSTVGAMKINRYGRVKVLTQQEIQLIFSHGLENDRDRSDGLRLRPSLTIIHSWMSEFRVQRSKFRVQRSKFRVQRSKFRVQRSEFRVQRSKFRVQRSKFRVQRSKFRVLKVKTGVLSLNFGD
ncbi:MAG: hypothetical protein ACYTXY_29515, partial [Nostoc sp.]